MTKPGQMEAFDALYAMAAGDGREEALFGSCAPLAREAFERSLVGEGFPVVWFEVPLAGSPRFDLELQFDVMRDGTLGPTLGISACFPFNAAAGVQKLFAEDGPAAVLMGEIEREGLADGRWRHVPGASFSKLVGADDGPLALYCTPTFVKLRMRDGDPLDAKVYLQAAAFALSPELAGRREENGEP